MLISSVLPSTVYSNHSLSAGVMFQQSYADIKTADNDTIKQC